MKAGSFENIAPESTHVIVAKTAQPKVEINTHTIDYDDEKTDVLVGQKDENKEVTYLDASGNTHHKKTVTSAPVYGEIHRNIPIGHHVAKQTYDLKTGDLIEASNAVSTFGTRWR